MKQITLNIKEHKFPFFMELIKSLDFVSVDSTANKTAILDDIRAGAVELAQVKSGKLKVRDAQELIDEL